MMTAKAMVVIARYRPFRRSEGTPTTSPAMAAQTPPARMHSGIGHPSLPATMPAAYAPTARNPEWPSEMSPVVPVRTLRPSTPTAVIISSSSSDT